MMSIAFVSLLFLPGTFVASFFQTPMFNFPDPENEAQVIVPQPFWIYWTVSGVLTLVLGLGWMSYLRRRRTVDLLEREVERRQLSERIRRRRDGGPVSFFMERARTMDERVARRAGLLGKDGMARGIEGERAWSAGKGPYGKAIKPALDHDNVVGAGLPGNARHDYSWHDPHIGV